MKLSRADINYQIRIQAVKRYLSSGSIEDCASFFNITPKTLRRWLKRYQEGGEENLYRKKVYTRHPTRFVPSIEKKIVILKQRKPSLTLLEAQKTLNKKGIKISINGIWSIWKRYNLAGFRRKNFQSAEATETSLEVEHGLRKAEQMLNKRALKKAARILNALPSCDGQDILKKIPDSLLSLSRRVEKLDLTFRERPFRETAREAKILREKAENKRLFYTSVRAGINELFAMEPRSNSEKQFILAERLLRRLEKKNFPSNANPSLCFSLLVIKGKALAHLGRPRGVLYCIRKCVDLCRYLTEPEAYRNIAALYSSIGFYKKSRYWIKKSLECTQDKHRDISYEYLAAVLAIAGKYRAAKKALKEVKANSPTFQPLTAMINAHCFLNKGNIQDAVQYAIKALSTSRKQGILRYFLASVLTLVCCACALNERGKAISYLERLISIVEKFRIRDMLFLIKVLLGQNSLPRDAVLIPIIRLGVLLSRASESLKTKDYRKAFEYATSQELMGFFHRLVLCFPESVNKLIAKGKPTGLPKALLNLPVFRKNIPVYHLKFLGPPRFYRNSVRLRHYPSPMYASFLIRLSCKRKLELVSIYNNFWHNAKDPRSSLSHFLFGLRKYLRLPPDTLFIKQDFLYFKGYITTDYQFYEETITRAKVLERAGEWGFAKKEYLRAFKLFRGEPFKKMYDNWSEDMRRVILNKLETEVLHFTKSCMKHKNRKDAQKVLKRVSKIIPKLRRSKKDAERVTAKRQTPKIQNA